MNTETLTATYQRLRQEPFWRLLASDHGPIIIGLLQTHLYENERFYPHLFFTSVLGAI